MISSLSDRSEYEALQDNTYLNQASLGLIGCNSVAAMHKFLDEVAQYGNLYMSDEDEVNYFKPVRGLISKLLKCEPNRVAITSGASEILGQTPYLFTPGSEDEIILVSTDFPAVTRPWVSYSRKVGCKLIFIKDNKINSLTEEIIKHIKGNTAVIAVSHVQFSTGTKIDVRRVREAMPSNTKLVVDVTQSAGVVPIDPVEWKADIIVSSGYKWLEAHGGVGIAIFSKALLKEKPILIGWMSAPEPFIMMAKKDDLALGARRYTLSTMSYLSIKSLEKSLQKILELGVENIAAHVTSLGKKFSEELDSCNWKQFRSSGDASASSHIVSLSKSNIDLSKTFERLKEHKLYCSLRNNRLRVSIAHYNNEEDLLKLVELLK